jgi:DNA polymerase-3 subunit alpha
MEKNFVHLHTHSHYSLLDGLTKVDAMVKRAQELKMPALALTDHGNMYGAIEFYKICKSHGIKPIIGVEAYIAERTRFDKEPGIDAKRYHLTLLAKNETGYKNLLKLVSKANLEGYYYKPRMDKELLREHSEGIICLSGCFGGELSRALSARNEEKARAIIAEHQDIFGKENYFLEVMAHVKMDGAKEVRDGLIALGRELNIPLVATHDSHYLGEDDHKAHDTLLAVQTGSDTKDANRLTFGNDDFSLIDAEKAYEFFKDIPDAVANTLRVAEMCDIEIELGKWVFPDIKLPERSKSYDEELKKLTYEGIATREIEKTKEVEDRIEYELKIIMDKGYAPYFLVVADLLRFAHENNIFTNIRGSVAGSIVTYLTGITKVNPLEYKLPFERFLNPERPSAPDIDMDFADNRRDEMIEYVKQKYGSDKVAQIGTFGTMMARGAVRDVARALGYPYTTGDRLSKLIPMGSQGFPMTIDNALKLTPELKAIYKNEKDAKEIIDLAKKLEGCVRHVSVHAAGVVISPTPLTDFAPLQFDPKGGKIITQYDMYVVEDVGLLKFDFLGIRNLSILESAVSLVKKLYGEIVDIEKIPLDDKKTFELLARGETEGLFQLNGDGMTRYLKELKPTTIHDINAMVALYRPGPMISIPDYIARKHNPSLIKYPDPRLKEILKESYGVIAYQDDVLLTAIHLAGYSWLEADKLRKAMGKKIPKEMAAQEEKFISGCVDKGMKPDKALEIWKLIEPFAAYGFNKAHAASYGRVAYQTAYMKAHYPAPYMAAILSAESGDIDKVAEIIAECKHMGIRVLPPDVNESFGDFTVVKNESGVEEIRFGLISTKNLGVDIAEAIIDERKQNGKYSSFADFLTRVKHKNLNKKSLESLVKSGSMDKLGERGQLLANTEEALAFAHAASHVDTAQDSLFGGMADVPVATINLKPSEPAKKGDMLAWEKELLGLYISGHPLDPWKEKLNGREMTVARLKATYKEGMLAVVAGIIEESKEVITKTNDRMAFLKISDFTGTIEAVVFPKLYKDVKDLCLPDRCVIARGRISKRNDETSLVIEEIKELK